MFEANSKVAVLGAPACGGPETMKVRTGLVSTPNEVETVPELRNVEADLARFRARVFVASVFVLGCLLLLASRLVYRH